MTEDCLYVYKAHVTDVYDGDTITVDLDLGLDIVVKDEKIRLFGINAPEMKGPEKAQGKIVRDYLRRRILNKVVYIQTIKDRHGRDKEGKFGRLLGMIFIDGVNINEELVEKGLAPRKDY